MPEEQPKILNNAENVEAPKRNFTDEELRWHIGMYLRKLGREGFKIKTTYGTAWIIFGSRINGSNKDATEADLKRAAEIISEITGVIDEPVTTDDQPKIINVIKKQPIISRPLPKFTQKQIDEYNADKDERFK